MGSREGICTATAAPSYLHSVRSKWSRNINPTKKPCLQTARYIATRPQVTEVTTDPAGGQEAAQCDPQRGSGVSLVQIPNQFLPINFTPNTNPKYMLKI